MNIHVTEDAARWYKNEMGLQTGDKLRFYVRYGGFSSFQKGFSLGVEKDEPTASSIQTTVDGITFYIEDKDEWYFSDQDLLVTYNPLRDEPEFKQENETSTSVE